MVLGMSTEPFADTPSPPYVAVIFTSSRTDGDQGYGVMSASMESLAQEQPGYLGIESARDAGSGITVSYWADHDAARAWKQVAAHLVAQRRGRDVWYQDYRVRVATVEREYGSASSELADDGTA
jgi:heme-degrading monooxygenase HmoA